MCIDATNETRLGKYINDSPNSYCNSKMWVKMFGNKPYLCLYACQDIPCEMEIRCNYDDKALEWKKDVNNIKETAVDFAVQLSQSGNVVSIDGQSDVLDNEEGAGDVVDDGEGTGDVVDSGEGVVDVVDSEGDAGDVLSSEEGAGGLLSSEEGAGSVVYIEKDAGCGVVNCVHSGEGAGDVISSVEDAGVVVDSEEGAGDVVNSEEGAGGFVISGEDDDSVVYSGAGSGDGLEVVSDSKPTGAELEIQDSDKEMNCVQNEIDINRYIGLIRKNRFDVDKIKDVLGDFSDEVVRTKTDEIFPKRKACGDLEDSPSKKKCIGSNNQRTAESSNNTQQRKKEFKCPECGKILSGKLSRHMRLVHSSSNARVKSAIISNKYESQNDGKLTSGRKTRGGKIDYHKLKHCPFDHCYVVRLRLGPHLVEKHNMQAGSNNYRKLLKNAQPWKPMPDKSKRDEVRLRVHQDSIRTSIEENEQTILPDFTDESDYLQTVYIPPTKEQLPIPCQGGSAKTLLKGNKIGTNQIMSKFYNYLTSLDGGDLSGKSADLYTQEVMSVMKSLGTDDFTDLFNKSKMRESFLNRKSDDTKLQYKASTKQKYFTALIHFCCFVSNEQINVLSYTRDDILCMRTLYTNWRKSLNKQVQIHQSIRFEEENNTMILPGHVALWETGERKREAIMLLGKFSSTNPPSLNKTIYCTIRDFLVVEIEIQNSHRSGVLSNLTIQEFKTAKKETVEENVLWRVNVQKHKTLRTHGFAKMFLSEQIYNYMNIFVNTLRSKILGNDPHVFVTFNGRQMTSGEISTQLNSTWQRSGVYGDNPKPKTNISCTQFRKSASSLILEHNPEASRPVADLLAHGQSTQQKYYDVRRRQKSSAVGALSIGRVFRGSRNIAKPEDLREDELIPDNINGSPSKRTWCISEVQEIRSLFVDFLKEEKKITIEDVRYMQGSFLELKGISFKKIYDKIRGLIRYGIKSKESLKLPTEESTSTS